MNGESGDGAVMKMTSGVELRVKVEETNWGLGSQDVKVLGYVISNEEKG